MDITTHLRKYSEMPSQITAMQSEIDSLGAQLRSMEESLKKAISDSTKISSDCTEDRDKRPLSKMRLLAGILIVLISAGIAVYSWQQISSDQGYVATDQHGDQLATGALVASVGEALSGNFQSSEDYYKLGTKELVANGPLIDHYENDQATYSLPLILSTLVLGALFGWVTTEILGARRHKARSHAAQTHRPRANETWHAVGCGE